MSQQAHRPGTTVPGRSIPALSATLRTAIGEYRAAPPARQREAGLRLAEAAEAAIALIEIPAVPPHPQRSPQFLAAVAEIYRAYLDHAPVQAVAKALGVERQSASRYVHMARRHGYLPPTSQGKARG